MAKGLQDIHDTVARDRAVIELQKEILSAQSTQAVLVESVSTLKGRVAELEAWNAESKRYERREVARGVIAYTLKQPLTRYVYQIHSFAFLKKSR
jgi:hypothetical protein